ncbi:MAG: class I SAM-dependent methyltransferase [Salibacteraceae bacterium]
MPFDFHTDKSRYFSMQYETTRDYILPMLAPFLNIGPGLSVLEIGCAEAGVLKAFTEHGCQCLGIELASNRLEWARKFMHEEAEAGLVSFRDQDIHKVDLENDLTDRFDLVILKDVIEHIHDQESFVRRLAEFLKPNGFIFYAFPPWYMPFGGHQQLADHKLLAKLPYVHLLPMPLYKTLLRAFGESETKVKNLAEIKETGISIERFERLVRKAGFDIVAKKHFLFNPIYKYKFGIKPKQQFALISALPFIRNFFTTGVYYLTQRKN